MHLLEAKTDFEIQKYVSFAYARNDSLRHSTSIRISPPYYKVCCHALSHNAAEYFQTTCRAQEAIVSGFD
jgi:hypothetical protein